MMEVMIYLLFAYAGACVFWIEFQQGMADEPLIRVYWRALLWPVYAASLNREAWTRIKRAEREDS